MRVVTGCARGMALETVQGTDIVRPTTQKVKEAVFSTIQFDIPFAKVLDLFCGCGQMGIEALSRGAEFCVFVDSNKKSLDVTKANLTKTSLFKQSRVVAMDCKNFLTTTKDTFDIAFLDPPYNKGMLEEALALLTSKMGEKGIILCEHDKHDTLPQEIEGFYLKKKYSYSRVAVSRYERI